ncbi:hypothetical protein APS58_1727 [Paracidovorax citrulli]|nr:hypothetical protein APS58_1727 [Paracidovorax citrulli]SDJ76470.1 Peptidoglycan/LPS O-acetylase OafA/YrhL, contains acyltransferase and SGNH-hydrolase domains [Paracidovorax citrulli]
MRNIKSLQILRALAATSVVYFHIKAEPVFGSFGVDIFFVLSGFLMAMIMATGEPATRFAVSRVSRIVPLYWILTTSVLLLAALKPELLNSTTANLGNYARSLLFIPYFKENGALHPMLAVGWTLNYEMFFYLCAWLVLLARAKARHVQMISVAFLITAAYLAGKYASGTVAAEFFGTSLVFEFILGMLAHAAYRKNILARFRKSHLFLAAAASYMAMACLEIREVDVPRVLLFGVPSTLLVMCFIGCEETRFVQESKLSGVLVSIGDASYATYLSHYYVVEGVRKIAHQKMDLIDPYTPFGIAVILGLALGCGSMMYVFVDRPLSRYFKRKLLHAGTAVQPH